MNGWRLLRVPATCVAMFFALGVANLAYPVCADTLGISRGLGVLTIGAIVIAGNVFMFRGWWRRRRRTLVNQLEWRDLRWFPVLLSGALCVMVASGREHRSERWRWTFDGLVTDKYRSTNHGAYSVRVDGRAYEFVSKSFWKSIEVGDHVAKQACSPNVDMDGRTVAIVD